MARGSWPRGGVRTRLPITFWKSGAEFTPTEIPGLALWLDASDAATLFQDAAATTPATATSDPVGAWLDKSGNARHATQSLAASRPVVGSLGSGRGLVFDSNDSLLSLAAMSDIIGSFSSSPASTIAFIALNSSGAAGFTMGSDNAANGRFLVSNSFDAAGGSFFDVAGSSGGRLSYSLPASSQTAASVYVMQRNGASMIVRRNGATIASKADASQTYSAATARLAIGQAIGLTGFAGTCSSVLCYPSALSATQYRRLETYLAARWGITLAPQVSNADAQDWINRVYANGGTVSASTAAAVNTFCDAIDAASIRDRFYRLSLFCGSNLNAALVPLYRGPSLGGTQYGNTTDTNVGPFVTGDYSETGATGGLVGNGSSKRLETGFSLASLPSAASRHISVYEIAKSPNANDTSIGGTHSNSVDGMILGTRDAATTYAWSRGGPNDAVISASSYSGGAHWVAQNTTLRESQLYKNGTLDNSATLASDVTSTAANTIDLYAWKITGGSPDPTWVFYSSARLGGYSIGLSMTAPQVAAYRTAMQAFQTALTRNV